MKSSMELNNPQFQTTKKIIRAILSASARGTTVHELDSSYKEYEGQSIPFREYGFTNLYSFLNYMADTVRWVTMAPMDLKKWNTIILIIII